MHYGYTTTLSTDGENADEDFYFMAHAKHFIETAGVFFWWGGRHGVWPPIRVENSE